MTLEDAVSTDDGIPDAELAIVAGNVALPAPGVTDICNAIMLDFPTNEPVATIAPVGRVRTVR